MQILDIDILPIPDAQSAEEAEILTWLNNLQRRVQKCDQLAEARQAIPEGLRPTPEELNAAIPITRSRTQRQKASTTTRGKAAAKAPVQPLSLADVLKGAKKS